MLPPSFPNLLVNGASGIAVGLATNIPPHNLREIIEATAAQIDNPDISLDELMKYVPGPTFPPGACSSTRRSCAPPTRRGAASSRCAPARTSRTGPPGES